MGTIVEHMDQDQVVTMVDYMEQVPLDTTQVQDTTQIVVQDYWQEYWEVAQKQTMLKKTLSNLPSNFTSCCNITKM